MDELIYDSNIATFTQSDTQDFLYQSLFYGRSTSPPALETLNVEVHNLKCIREVSLNENLHPLRLVIVN